MIFLESHHKILKLSKQPVAKHFIEISEVATCDVSRSNLQQMGLLQSNCVYSYVGKWTRSTNFSENLYMFLFSSPVYMTSKET